MSDREASGQIGEDVLNERKEEQKHCVTLKICEILESDTIQ